MSRARLCPLYRWGNRGTKKPRSVHLHPGHWPQGQRCPRFSAQDVAARVGQCPPSAALVSRGPPWVSGGLRDRGRPRGPGERPCSAPARPAGGLIPASEADVAALLPTLTRTAGDLDFVTGRNKGKNGRCDYGCFISKHFLRHYVFRAVFIHSKTERKMEPPRAPCPPHGHSLLHCRRPPPDRDTGHSRWTYADTSLSPEAHSSHRELCILWVWTTV